MKALLLAAVVLSLAAQPALAQNPAQVARARAGAACPRCNLFQADFAGLRLTGKDFSGARLRQADFSLSVMHRLKLARADLRDVNLYGAVITQSDFAGADLTHASLVGADLDGSSFTAAKLEGADLSGAELRRVRGLTQAGLDHACGDASTKLPRGLHVAACK